MAFFPLLAHLIIKKEYICNPALLCFSPNPPLPHWRYNRDRLLLWLIVVAVVTKGPPELCEGLWAPAALAPWASSPSPASTGSAQQCQHTRTLGSQLLKGNFLFKMYEYPKRTCKHVYSLNIWIINKRWPENGISLERRELNALPLTHFSISLGCNFQLIWLSAILIVFMLKRQFQCLVKFDPFRSDSCWFELSLSGWMQWDLVWTVLAWFYPVYPAGICCLYIDPHSMEICRAQLERAAMGFTHLFSNLFVFLLTLLTFFSVPFPLGSHAQILGLFCLIQWIHTSVICGARQKPHLQDAIPVSSAQSCQSTALRLPQTSVRRYIFHAIPSNQCERKNNFISSTVIPY